jgi:O-antigen ligase
VTADWLPQAAEWLAVAVAVSLPWSTSASSILIVLWLLALLPTISVSSLFGTLTFAGTLPALLWLWGSLGMLWADADWPERLGGLSGLHKLLVIPLLLYQFAGSERGAVHVLLGFFFSCVIVLAFSWAFTIWPSIAWSRMLQPGVPVKEYILQSGEFLLCAFGAGYLAAAAWNRNRKLLAGVLGLLAAAFIADILYVALGRTAIFAMPFLAAVTGWRHFGVRGVLVGGAVLGAIVLIAWSSSPYLRDRLYSLKVEIDMYEDTNEPSSAGKRMEFWQKSAHFIETAPIIGHGTGSIRSLFVQSEGNRGGADAVISNNPHNQILTIAVQLGLVGAGLLLAMWLAHALLFRGAGIVASIGLLIVIQNIISCLFNSQLSDFTQGWEYVFGVGACGGAVLRQSKASSTAPVAPMSG